MNACVAGVSAAHHVMMGREVADKSTSLPMPPASSPAEGSDMGSRKMWDDFNGMTPPPIDAQIDILTEKFRNGGMSPYDARWAAGVIVAARS